MNDEHDRTELDRMLGQWAERRQRDGRLEGLEARILAALREPADPARFEPAPAPTHRLAHVFRGRMAWFVLGAAAAMVVVASLSLIPWGSDPDVHRGGGPPPPAEPAFAHFDQNHRSEKTVLLREMERLFAGRVEWIAETDGRVLFEVQNNGLRPSTSPDPGLAVRLVVVRRGRQETAWTPVWTLDLVTRSERFVRLDSGAVGLPQGADLTLWAYAVDDDVLAVDSELSFAGLPVASRYSGCQRAGMPVIVHSVERPEAVYRVFQTVIMLGA